MLVLALVAAARPPPPSPRRRPARPAAARQRHRPARLARHRAPVGPTRHRGRDPGHERSRTAQGEAVALDRARRTFALQLACQGDGTIRVRARASPRAPSPAAAIAARGRATARLTHAQDRQAAHGRGAAPPPPRSSARPAAVTAVFRPDLGPGGGAEKGFWTDGHLDCAQGFLVEPDFTTRTPIPISTRGWVAWYTPATGWHWLGNAGENAGRWNAWTASVAGVTQFHPGGAAVPVPWTLGPISVPPGRGIYAVGVYEIVYWVGGRADHQWQYVNAGTTGAVAAGAPNQYCVYP